MDVTDIYRQSGTSEVLNDKNQKEQEHLKSYVSLSVVFK